MKSNDHQQTKVDAVNPAILISALANIKTNTKMNHDQNKCIHVQVPSDEKSCIRSFLQAEDYSKLKFHSTQKSQKPPPSHESESKCNKASQRRGTHVSSHSNAKVNKRVVSDPLKPQVTTTKTIVSALSIMHATKSSNETGHSATTIKKYFSLMTVITLNTLVSLIQIRIHITSICLVVIVTMQPVL